MKVYAFIFITEEVGHRSNGTYVAHRAGVKILPQDIGC